MSDGAPKPDDGSIEFLEQARWLLEWHNKRSEAITTRATALLGFVGVVLALLLQGSSIGGIEPRWWTWLLLVTSLVGLLATSVYALFAVLPKKVNMPSVSQLREWWSKKIAEPGRGQTGAQIAESILFGQNTDADSPISDAVEEATDRAVNFKVAAWALLCTFVPLSGLVLDVLTRVGR